MKSYSLIVLCLSLIAGCGDTVTTESHYLLHAERPPASASDTRAILDVPRLTVDSAFASKGLIYRKTESQYVIDYYHRFLVSPSQMITERTRDWFSRSGLFERVLTPVSLTEPTHTLQGHVNQLYGDYRDKTSPLAVMEITFYVISHQQHTEVILHTQSYRHIESIQTNDISGLVQALDLCLQRILTDLEQDLTEVME